MEVWVEGSNEEEQQYDDQYKGGASSPDSDAGR